MIGALVRKEYEQNKKVLSLALIFVLLVTATMPYFFQFALKHAFTLADDATSQGILRNFRSYAVFLETPWLARNLAWLLFLLAVLAGAGAIAGERESRTLPLLYQSSLPLRDVVLVKFAVIAAFLLLVTFASDLVLAIHSFFGHLPFPLLEVTLASLVAWTNALAFLGVVFIASAFAPRTAYAGLAAFAMGFAIFGALALLKVNVSELAANLFAVDGAIIWRNAFSDLCVGAAIACFAMLFTLREVDRRRAT